MPFVDTPNARLYYRETGRPDGFPVLAIAPGGMRSADELWAAMPWDPHARLGDGYRVIGMDQRNAGLSSAPISAGDSWETYTADQLALLDRLGIDSFAVVGMCIGGPYAMGLVKAAGPRVRAAILLQPIGLDDNRQAFYDMFDAWADGVRGDHPEADADAFAAFRASMYDGDFLFNTTRDEVAACNTPLLVAMGNDLYHPQSTSREIARLAPNVTLVEAWKDEEHLAAADVAFRSFLDTWTADR
jgi:pimeloyl-ACP methyl ester carboxylesterase